MNKNPTNNTDSKSGSSPSNRKQDEQKSSAGAQPREKSGQESSQKAAQNKHPSR